MRNTFSSLHINTHKLKSYLCLIIHCDLSCSCSKLQEKQWKRLDRRASTLLCQEKQCAASIEPAVPAVISGLGLTLGAQTHHSHVHKQCHLLKLPLASAACSQFCCRASLPPGQWQDRCGACSSAGLAQLILVMIDWTLSGEWGSSAEDRLPVLPALLLWEHWSLRDWDRLPQFLSSYPITTFWSRGQTLWSSHYEQHWPLRVSTAVGQGNNYRWLRSWTIEALSDNDCKSEL